MDLYKFWDLSLIFYSVGVLVCGATLTMMLLWWMCIGTKSILYKWIVLLTAVETYSFTLMLSARIQYCLGDKADYVEILNSTYWALRTAPVVVVFGFLFIWTARRIWKTKCGDI
jgi:hypothetical protein